MCPCIPDRLEFGSVGFSGEGNTEIPEEKPLEARRQPTAIHNPHMMPAPGIEPGPHWCEVGALTTVSLVKTRLIP